MEENIQLVSPTQSKELAIEANGEQEGNQRIDQSLLEGQSMAVSVKSEALGARVRTMTDKGKQYQ